MIAENLNYRLEESAARQRKKEKFVEKLADIQKRETYGKWSQFYDSNLKSFSDAFQYIIPEKIRGG